jgi:hypothetical protein
MSSFRSVFVRRLLFAAVRVSNSLVGVFHKSPLGREHRPVLLGGKRCPRISFPGAVLIRTLAIVN